MSDPSPQPPPRYPCPCCGHLVFTELPGSDDICLVCFWEDDIGQLRWPSLEEGANAPSLIDAQKNFVKLGAIEERFVGDVRKPLPEEALDPGFRVIAESDVFEEHDDRVPFPDDPTTLYYWRRR